MSALNFSYDTEFFKHLQHADTMAPVEGMKAITLKNGLSLLFHIDSNGALIATEESSGKSETGWSQKDISSAFISQQFKGATGIKCSAFNIAVNESDQTFDICLAIRGASTDSVFFSGSNSLSAGNWSQNLHWAPWSVNLEDQPIDAYRVSRIDLLHPSNGLICCLGLQTPSFGPLNLISDPEFPAGAHWKFAMGPGPIEESTKNVLVRTNDKQAQVPEPYPGMKAIGLFSVPKGQPVISLSPYYYIKIPFLGSVHDGTPHNIPAFGGVTPEVITACWKDHNELENLLFSVSGNHLAVLNSNAGSANSFVLACDNALFSGTTDLFAYNTGKNVLVWGINEKKQLYFTQCASTQVGNTTQWAYPAVLMEGVSSLTPAINPTVAEQVLFVSANDRIQKLFLDATAGYCVAQMVALPATNHNLIQQSVFTSRIEVRDSGGRLASNVEVDLSSGLKAGFYYNGIYTVLNSSKTTLKTDKTGVITLIQPALNLTGSSITVSAVDQSVTAAIHPTQRPFEKLAGLNTVAKLRAAMVNHRDGTQTPLVSPSTTDAALQKVVAANKKLLESYPGAQALQPASSREHETSSDLTSGSLFHLPSFGIHLPGGTSSLEGVGSNLLAVVNKATGGHFKIPIKSAIDYFHAIKSIYESIAETLQEIEEFLEALFNIQAIKRTSDVIKNLTIIHLKDKLSGVQQTKTDFDNYIDHLESGLNGLGSNPTWFSESGIGTQPIEQQKPGNPIVKMTPRAQYMLDFITKNKEVKNHLSSTPNTNEKTPSGSSSSPIQAFYQKSQEINGDYSVIYPDIFDAIRDIEKLNPQQILNKLFDLLKLAALEKVRGIGDAFLDMIIYMGEAEIDNLDKPINIPVMSYFFNLFGISAPTLLDLFCLVPAVVFNTGYYAFHHKEPFPKNEITSALIQSKSTSELKQFIVSHGGDAQNGPIGIQYPSVAYVLNVLSAAFGIVTIPLMYEEASQDGLLDSVASKILTFCRIFSAVTRGASDLFFSPIPIKNEYFRNLDVALSGMLIMKSLALRSDSIVSLIYPSGTGDELNSRIPAKKQIGAALEFVFLLPSSAITCAHFVELSHESASVKKTVTVLDECANLTRQLGYMAQDASLISQGDSNEYSQPTMMLTLSLSSGLRLAEALVILEEE